MSFPSRFYISRGKSERSLSCDGDFIGCRDAALAITKFTEENFGGILTVDACVMPSTQGFYTDATLLAKMICRIARLAFGVDVVRLKISLVDNFFVLDVKSKVFEDYATSYDVELIRMANGARLITNPKSDGIEFRIATTKRGVGVVRAISVSVFFRYLEDALREYENDGFADM